VLEAVLVRLALLAPVALVAVLGLRCKAPTRCSPCGPASETILRAERFCVLGTGWLISDAGFRYSVGD
jgi:hypothetical protein